MRLQQLRLRNFKGVRDFTLDVKGENVAIYGENATGKTTLFDAFMWLLFDKDSSNHKDFEIKTLDVDGKTISGIDHEVEAVLDLGDKQLTLRKVYAEKWTKKRGSPTAEFTGHQTDYFVNNIPVRENAYKAAIVNITDESAFKLLTNPRYFPDLLDWQKRRKILLDMCGDVSDADVISSDASLAELPAILQGRALEDHRKVILANRTEINKALQAIPVRIDEVSKSLPLVPADANKIAIQPIKDQRREKERQRTTLESGGAVAEKTKEMRLIEAEMARMEREHWTANANTIQAAKTELTGITDATTDLSANNRNRQRTVRDNEAVITQLETQMATWRAKWKETNARAFTCSASDTCPTCGQMLPEEQVQAAQDKAKANFNREKSETLEAIQKDGKTAKDRVDFAKADNEVLAAEIKEAEAQMAVLNNQAKEIQARKDELELQTAAHTTEPKYQEAQTKKDDIEKAIASLKVSNTEALAEITQEIKALDDQLGECERILAQIEQAKKGQERVAELKAQERKLAAEYESLEKQLYLTEQFTRSKVRLLEERINSRFKLARFKMFNTLINGGIEECCEVLYEGVPYSTALNNSARINVGLDIINALSEHYKFSAPIFVDNAEAVTQLLATSGQQIRLYVSEKDKALRIEAS